jgi:hypothetical protein
VNNNVNEEDLKCQQKAEHKYDSLFSDTIKVSPKNKKGNCSEHNSIKMARRKTTIQYHGSQVKIFLQGCTVCLKEATSIGQH